MEILFYLLFYKQTKGYTFAIEVFILSVLDEKELFLLRMDMCTILRMIQKIVFLLKLYKELETMF